MGPHGRSRPAGPRRLQRIDADQRSPAGRLVAVWGPTGAPGGRRSPWVSPRAGRRRSAGSTLLDADPYGGAVGQHLAVLDEVSGLLAAARLANAASWTPARLAGLARRSATRLRVLTGLPRPDRWPEVRPQAFDELLDRRRELDDARGRRRRLRPASASRPTRSPGAARDEMTVTALERADAIVVVGSADPVGLTRLARGLRELRDVRPRRPRRRRGQPDAADLGWSEREVAAMVERVAPGSSVRFLPDDRAAADRALIGRAAAWSSAGTSRCAARWPASPTCARAPTARRGRSSGPRWPPASARRRRVRR